MSLVDNPAIYRAVWRWHFYAGLIVAPFMLMLSVTGAIYLFKEDINDLLYAHERIVSPGHASLPLSQLVAAAETAASGGVATRIDPPATPDRSAQVFVTGANGERRVSVNSATAEVLGIQNYQTTLVGLAEQLHGSLMLGKIGDAIVELAACWGAVLIVTGLYLWWPRGRRGVLSALTPSFRAKGRPFWKSLHAAMGAWASAVILFLILTGLPWANVWGTLLRGGADLVGIGYPAAHRSHGLAPVSTPTLREATGEAPWTLEQAPMPRSDDHSAHHGGGGMMPSHAGAGAIGVDRAAAILADAGISMPYRLSLPKGPSGVYTAVVYPGDPRGQRTVQLDQYSGRILTDVAFGQYGVAAKAVEFGVQLHMGNFFGRANQFLMLFACVGVAGLSMTGPIMWWKRRPKGRLGAPRPLEPARLRSVALITLALGLVFPLAGLSLLVALGIERWVAPRVWRGGGSVAAN
ncbi:PepSY-associated TM helix domain-containing protein [Hansschlegelia quercus]|uniref:PepSY domain-containing protein n=1 Tax=Hansschlegelia quercus TaxID=2528245 RepID=A0A4Q9GTQ1_9HYPH|nr:PepSY domain-containing protein [Hansschlegelia quercus]TBN55197.1 PepSY domain-containing protein [Hansschlegelia quercus]